MLISGGGGFEATGSAFLGVRGSRLKGSVGGEFFDYRNLGRCANAMGKRLYAAGDEAGALPEDLGEKPGFTRRELSLQLAIGASARRNK